MAMQVWVAFVNVVGKGCLLFVFGFYLFVVVIFTNCELAAAWLIKNLYRRTGNADSFRLKPPRRREGKVSKQRTSLLGCSALLQIA